MSRPPVLPSTATVEMRRHPVVFKHIDHDGQAVRARRELAIGVDDELRDVEDIGVVQLQAQLLARLRLHFCPICNAAMDAIEQVAGVHGMRVRDAIITARRPR